MPSHLPVFVPVVVPDTTAIILDDAATTTWVFEPGMGHAARDPPDLLILRLTSLCLGAISLAATLFVSYFFLRIRRSFRHELILLLFFGDLIKGLCFITFPIVALALGNTRIPSSSPFCQVNGFLLTVGTEASDVAVLLVALHTVLYIVRRSRDGGLHRYRYVAYAVYVLYPLVNAAMAFVHGLPGYEDTGEFCYLPVRESWYRTYLAWVPRYVIFGLIVVLYAGLFVFVRVEQWRLAREGGWSTRTSSALGDGDGAAKGWGWVPRAPVIECHGLVPEADTSGSDPSSSAEESRRGSDGVLGGERRESKGGTIASINLDGRRGSGKSVKFSPVAWASKGAQKAEDAAAPEEPVQQEKGGMELAPEVSCRDESMLRRITWNWGGQRMPMTGFPLQKRHVSESPIPPTAANPNLQPLAPGDIAPDDNTPSPHTTQRRRTAFVPITAPPLPKLRQSSSLHDLVAALREGPPGRRWSDDILSRRDSTARRYQFLTAESNTPRSAGSSVDSNGGAEHTRARVRKQLRLLFVYPLVYMTMWLVPCVSHALGYDDDDNARDEPLWVVGLGVASLAVQGAVNAGLFAWRERPWRRRRGAGGDEDGEGESGGREREWEREVVEARERRRREMVRRGTATRYWWDGEVGFVEGGRERERERE